MPCKKKEKKNGEKGAFEYYTLSLKELNLGQIDQAIQLCEQSIAALGPLGFQEQKELKRAKLQFEILLLQKSPSDLAIKALLDDLEVVKKSLPFEKMKDNIHKFEKENTDGHSISARFFLLSAFSYFPSSNEKKEESPEKILQGAIDRAHLTLQLLMLSQMTQVLPPYAESQAASSAKPFTLSVLKEQKMRFQEAKDGDFFCQSASWPLALPLFEDGLRFAKKGEVELEKPIPNPQTAIAFLELTLKNWEQALKIILNPPSTKARLAIQRGQKQSGKVGNTGYGDFEVHCFSNPCIE